MYYRADLHGIAEFILDEENPTVYREVLDFWLASKKEYPRRFRKRMGDHPIMRDDEKVLPLQAADLIAWTFGKLSGSSPYPPFAVDTAKQLTVPGLAEMWTRDKLQMFSSRMDARGGNPWEYETGKQRSVRLRELLGPRK